MLAIDSERLDVPTVSTVVARDCDRDGIGLSLPRAEVRIAVRFKPQAPGVLDVHAFGVRQSVHRKPVRRGQRVMVARLQLGASRRPCSSRAERWARWRASSA